MSRTTQSSLSVAGVALLALAAVAVTTLVPTPFGKDARADNPPAAPAATPVPVAVVEPRETRIWDEFSGRIEAVERVDIRSRVAGAVQSVHFREGSLVEAGDRLVTIDPAPFEAAVARAQAQLLAAQARLAYAKQELDRAEQLTENHSVAISKSTFDQRTNAFREAEANSHAAEAELQAAQLDLGYTEVRAPVAGRVGRLEVTVGNLVAAGPGAPVLTTLVSVDPIYASFDADEAVVARVIDAVGASGDLDRIPVEIATTARDDRAIKGHLQLINNQVDTGTGTVRLRAVFDNPEGRLMPGQFARVRMGQPESRALIAITERAVGTDQDKKFVFVVDGDNKATYREVQLGAATGNLRVVTSGLKQGERIVVNGLHRVRPGALLAPEPVPMDSAAATPPAPARLAGG